MPKENTSASGSHLTQLLDDGHPLYYWERGSQRTRQEGGQEISLYPNHHPL